MAIATKPLILSVPQMRVLRCRKPLILTMSGQRGGKSFGIGVRSFIMAKSFPQLTGMIAANTYKQLEQSTLKECRDIWGRYFNANEYDPRANPNGCYVMSRQPPLHFKKFHLFDNYHGIISFINGAVIYTASLENYLAHDGKTLGWAELDETKDTREDAVRNVILARLSQKGLWVDDNDELFYDHSNAYAQPINPCVINTSPSSGVVDWLVELFELRKYEEEINATIFNDGEYFFREFGVKAVCIYSTYFNQHNLTPNYIANRKASLTKEGIDKFIYGYPFAKTGDEYYTGFDRQIHIAKVDRINGLADHVSFDFNLVPYMTMICVQIATTDSEVQVRVYKEYCYKPPRNTTEAVCAAFAGDYGKEVTSLYYYGDSMGTRGVEGFGDKFTRFDAVRQWLYRYTGASSDRTTRRNVSVNKRRDFVNRVLEGKAMYGGRHIRLMIDVNCAETIKEFQYLKIGINGKLKEKANDNGRVYEKYGHISDALEYLLAEVFQGLIV